MAGLFPEHLKPDLQDVSREFHLQRIDGARWHLSPVHSVKARLHSRKRQVLFDNPHRSQPLGFILQNVSQKPIGALALTGGKRRTALANGPLQPGQILQRGSEGTGAVAEEAAPAHFLPLDRKSTVPSLPLSPASRQSAAACRRSPQWPKKRKPNPRDSTPAYC